jgi:hypothetical protein
VVLPPANAPSIFESACQRTVDFRVRLRLLPGKGELVVQLPDRSRLAPGLQLHTEPAYVLEVRCDLLSSGQVQLLGKVLGAAVDAGMLAQSPCRRVPLPKVEREEMRFLTPARVATLADAIASRYRALVLVGAYGGLRIGELAGLRRGRVDLLRGTVEVAEILTEVRGELFTGPAPDAGCPPPGWPAAGGDPRAGPASRDTRDLDDLVFTAPQGGPLRVNGFRARVWRPATRAAELDGLRIHDLRHTAVALWDRRRGEPQGGLGPGGPCLGQLHAGPLRASVPGGGCGAP